MTRAAFLSIRPAAARALGVNERDVSVCLTYRAGVVVESMVYWQWPGQGWAREELETVLELRFKPGTTYTIPSHHRDYSVTIHCGCGKDYDSPAQKLHKCPHCGRTWDMAPKSASAAEQARNWAAITHTTARCMPVSPTTLSV